MIPEDLFEDEHIFLILTVEPWYGDVIIYMHTLKVPSHLLRDECRHLHHKYKNYLIIDDTLYRRGLDSILR